MHSCRMSIIPLLHRPCLDNGHILQYKHGFTHKLPLGIDGFRAAICLFFTKTQAIRALILRRIALMGAHQNTVQRTIIDIRAVIRAVLNGTFNTLIHVHRNASFYFAAMRRDRCSISV